MPYKKKTIRCLICGKPYVTVHNAKTCSRKCQYAMTQHFIGIKLSKKQIALNQFARSVHPNTGPYETNCHARYWSIKSPEGVVYKFNNLQYFVRSNRCLFIPDDAATGYLGKRYDTRAGCQLSRLRPNNAHSINSWKGWSWHYTLQEAE
jgi:hypothetical protein